MPAYEELLDLVLPRRCVGCGRPAAGLCTRCTECGPPGRVSCGPLPVYAATGYAGAVRRALLRFKERGRRDLVGPLGALLAGAVAEALRSGGAPAGRVLLVPVPSARAAAAARGGDHVVRLAARAARLTGARVAPDVLTLVRAVRDSAGLGSAARAANLHQAMRARPALAGRPVVLVDDIVTTGSTLREANRALRAAGCIPVGAAVIAATPRRGAATGQGPGPPSMITSQDQHVTVESSNPHWQCLGQRASVGTT